MSENYPQQYLYKRVVQAKLFIDAHFNDDIDLDNIADEACFSKFHFIRLFKKIYAKTPGRYLTTVRIEKSKLLLQKGFSVSETCFSIGFESISSFTGLFKRYTTILPSEYGRQFKLRQERIKAVPLHFIPACFAVRKGLD